MSATTFTTLSSVTTAEKYDPLTHSKHEANFSLASFSTSKLPRPCYVDPRSCQCSPHRQVYHIGGLFLSSVCAASAVPLAKYFSNTMTYVLRLFQCK